MPILRPFRALRFDVGGPDLSAVLCPPYDIIGPVERRELLGRDARNAVRIELPADLGTAGPDDYRSSARTVAEWRSSGVLRKDREPTITLHRMTWRPTSGAATRATGVCARLRLEPFGPGAGVLPHERTLGGPKEDRYALLKATGLNTSPIVLLSDATEGAGPEERPPMGERIAALTARPADAFASVDGVDHEVWVVPCEDPGRDAGGERGPQASVQGERDVADPAALLASLASGPLTIADGHHRYETAIRYREERGRNRACESDPAWDYVLALVYPPGGAPPALPTHRVVLEQPAGAALLERLDGLVEVERLGGPEDLLARMARVPPLPPDANGTGRIGVASGDIAAVLHVRDGAIADGGAGVDGDPRLLRGLDVVALGALMEAVWGREPGSMADDGRLRYIKDPSEAVALVASGEAATSFLLDPVPPGAVTRVARAGEVMPQKSTYFHPKAPTGLLFSPMEW